jgi:branched-chain amino acid transport system ATP-binding protein
MALLEAADLTIAYGRVRALHGVTIRVDAGSIVCLIGPNGAGKTTTLLGLMGVLRSAGTITFLGRDLKTVSVEERVERGLCLVPERRELFGPMSVADNLALGAFPCWLRRESGQQEALKDVYRLFPRLRERARNSANTLSGGERQMLALGRALMARPKLLMLDEPSLGLSPLMAKEAFRTIMGLRDAGVSILLVEQNARAALRAADYAYVLENGAIRVEGPAAELATDPRVVETYLGQTDSN